jgi:TolB-like protein
LALKPTIAVLDLVADVINQGEARTLSNKLRSELIATGKYVVLERGNMEDVLSEQAFQQSGCVSDQCAMEAGQLLGVSHIAAGTIGRVGTLYYISLRLIDVGTGEIVKNAEQEVEGSMEDLLRFGMKLIANKISDISDPIQEKMSRAISADVSYVSVLGCPGIQVYLDDTYCGESPLVLTTRPGANLLSICNGERLRQITKTLEDFDRVHWEDYYYKDMKVGNGKRSELWFGINKLKVQKKLDNCRSNNKQINLGRGDTLYASIRCEYRDTILSVDRISRR